MKSLVDVFKSVITEEYNRGPDIMFVLPAYLYDEMKATGEYQMDHYVRQADHIPVDRSQSIYRSAHGHTSSEAMRAEIKRRAAAGEPLGASHVPEPFPEGVMVAGSLMGPSEYAKGPLRKDD